MDARLAERFRQAAPPVDFCSLRYVRERSEFLAVRQDVLQPVATSEDRGAMLTVHDGGGMGYAATSDLSLSGLLRAAEQAHECARLKIDDRIVDWDASLWYTAMDALDFTADGGQVEPRFRSLVPMLSATANAGADTQTRTCGGRGYCHQGGLEILDHLGVRTAAPHLAQEALQLLWAPNCPSGTTGLSLAPEQVILHIHESLGHPTGTPASTRGKTISPSWA
jgi:predicted Zn-dependent protease